MKSKGPGQSALLLLDVIHVLNENHVPYAVIGAFAASFHGVIRATLDADVLISLHPNRENVSALITKLKKSGLKVTYKKGDADDPVGAVINMEDDFHNRVDFLMNIKGMTGDVFKRTIEADFMNKKICIIGIEDFIAMKIFAGGPKDLNDIAGVLKVSYKKINLSLLRSLVGKYGKAAVSTLESFLKERNSPGQ